MSVKIKKVKLFELDDYEFDVIFQKFKMADKENSKIWHMVKLNFLFKKLLLKEINNPLAFTCRE